MFFEANLQLLSQHVIYSTAAMRKTDKKTKVKIFPNVVLFVRDNRPRKCLANKILNRLVVSILVGLNSCIQWTV